MSGHGPVERITLVDSVARVEREALLGQFGGDPLILADIDIDGVEAAAQRGEAKAHPWGFEWGRLHNVDHHADVPAMRQRISSTNLALRYVAERGVPGPAADIVITHTDCDSVLAAAILAGALPAHERFGAAAIAADHTGAEDELADVLQGLESRRDLALCLRSVRQLLAGLPLEPVAKAALAERRALRAECRQLVAAGAFQRVGRLAWLARDKALDAELAVAAMPDAFAVATFHPAEGEPGRWNARVRLGLGAVGPSASLFALDIAAFDPGFAGRWNAGSNRRSGGSNMAPADYAARLAEALARL